jgi:hypothetical protein
LKEDAMILKSFTFAGLLSLASVAFAQTQSGVTPPSTPSDTPSVTPLQTPAVTPSQTPSVTPSQPPSVTPSQTPSAASPSAPRPVGGMSQCQNQIGADRDKCLQDERAATTGGAGAGAGTTAR